MPKEGERGGRRARAGRPLRDYTAKIRDLIPIDAHITAEELKKKAKKSGIGYDTLYVYLRRLEKAGTIARGVDTSSPWKVPRVYYIRREFFELGPPPPTEEEKKWVARMKDVSRRFETYMYALPLWETILAECEKKEPGKFKALLAMVRSENIRALRIYLDVLALTACLIVMRATAVEDEGKRRDIVKTASNVFIYRGMDGFVTSPFFTLCDSGILTELWYEAGKPFAKAPVRAFTEKRISALRRLVEEATNAVASSDKAKHIAKRYIIDLSKRILKERGELEEGTEDDLKTLARKLGIKLKGDRTKRMVNLR